MWLLRRGQVNWIDGRITRDENPPCNRLLFTDNSSSRKSIMIERCRIAATKVFSPNRVPPFLLEKFGAAVETSKLPLLFFLFDVHRQQKSWIRKGVVAAAGQFSVCWIGRARKLSLTQDGSVPSFLGLFFFFFFIWYLSKEGEDLLSP